MKQPKIPMHEMAKGQSDEHTLFVAYQRKCLGFPVVLLWFQLNPALIDSCCHFKWLKICLSQCFPSVASCLCCPCFLFDRLVCYMWYQAMKGKDRTALANDLND